MNHQQFVTAMQQSQETMPTAVFVDGPDGQCRFQVLFVERDEALLEVLVGPSSRRTWSLKDLMSQDAIKYLEEFGYQRQKGLRVLELTARGDLSTILSGVWQQIEVLFKYIFNTPIDQLIVSTEHFADWGWE